MYGRIVVGVAKTDSAKRAVESTRFFQLAVSLGAVESLIEQPASMSHASYHRDARLQHGITDGLIRISVGLEAFNDLRDDLDGCAWLVRLLRTVRRGRSVLRDVPGGLEFWAEQDGLPIVTRIARVSALVREMADCGLTLRKRFATEFWDVNRFSAGLARRLAIDFNRLSFARMPASLSMGNALIAAKA